MAEPPIRHPEVTRIEPGLWGLFLARCDREGVDPHAYMERFARYVVEGQVPLPRVFDRLGTGRSAASATMKEA